MNVWNPIRNLFRPPLTGRHILFSMIAFFAVIFAVNGVFVYVSLQSHPGVTSDDAYRKGLRFNVELANADRQNARGWESTLTVKEGEIMFRLLDKAGQPLDGLTIEAIVQRPVHDRADRKLALQPLGGGRYSAPEIRLPVGRWNLIITATKDGEVPHRAEYSVQVRK